jgi:LysM repeat protein
MAARDDSGLTLWYIVPVVMLVLVFALGAVVVGTLRGTGDSPEKAAAAEQVRRDLPAYWTVREGQTFTSIAQRTGLSVDQLQSFNPQTDPASLVPGQRIKLRMRTPAAPRKRLGPQFWTVRSGQSYGSIAAATGRNIDTLQRLNPKLKAATLKPGDRVRLRR